MVKQSPWTSGGGEIWAITIKIMNTMLILAMALDSISASELSLLGIGSGPWTGEFQSLNIGYSLFQGSIFWTPGKGGWIGFTFGLSFGLPVLHMK